jgi:hypothetical protein
MVFNLFNFFAKKKNTDKKDEDQNILRKIKETVKNQKKENQPKEKTESIDTEDLKENSEDLSKDKDQKEEQELESTVGEIKEQIAKIKKLRRRRGKSRINKIKTLLRKKQKEKRLLLKRKKELFMQMVLERELKRLLQEKMLANTRKKNLKKNSKKEKDKTKDQKEDQKEDAVFKEARLGKERALLNKMEDLLTAASKDPKTRNQVDNDNLAQAGVIITQAQNLINNRPQAQQNTTNQKDNYIDVGMSQSLNLIQNNAKMIMEAIIDTGMAAAKVIHNLTQQDKSEPSITSTPLSTASTTTTRAEKAVAPDFKTNPEINNTVRNIANALSENGASLQGIPNETAMKNNIDRLGKSTREQNWGEISAMAKEANTKS